MREVERASFRTVRRSDWTGRGAPVWAAPKLTRTGLSSSCSPAYSGLSASANEQFYTDYCPQKADAS